MKPRPDFVHIAYGKRKDGTIGSEEEGNPVLTAIINDEDGSVTKLWSDDTVTIYPTLQAYLEIHKRN